MRYLQSRVISSARYEHSTHHTHPQHKNATHRKQALLAESQASNPASKKAQKFKVISRNSFLKLTYFMA